MTYPKLTIKAANLVFFNKSILFEKDEELGFYKAIQFGKTLAQGKTLQACCNNLIDKYLKINEDDLIV